MIGRGPWIQVFSGHAFYPLDPRPEDVRIDDIAHALSLQCRFSGHTKVLYTVAEHSVRMTRLVPPEHALAALLHDAAEAYVVDVPRPIKSLLTGYKSLEERVHRAICARFGLSSQVPEAVHRADDIMLVTEARDLLFPSRIGWTDVYGVEPLVDQIVPWSSACAEAMFLSTFRDLTGARA